MKSKLIMNLLVLISAFGAFSQSNKKIKEEKELIKITVDDFILGLNKGDSIKLSNTMHPDVRLTTCDEKEGHSILIHEKKEDFLKIISMPRENIWEEKLNNYTIKVNGNLAQVWCEYSFYLDSTLLHCGIDAFQLCKDSNSWKIIQITDTRVKSGCK